MSEQQFGSVMTDHEAHPLSAASDSSEITPGTYLRESREAAGLHLATLAASLKVSVGKLEALEHDRFDLLPDAVFTRALASSVCRMLKLDPAPVLTRLPPIAVAKFVSQNRGINTPFRHRTAGPAPSMLSQISRPAVLAGVVLLLGALVLIFLPSIRNEPSFAGLLGSPEVADKSGPQFPTDLLPTAPLEESAVADALPVPSSESVVADSPKAAPSAEALAAPAPGLVATGGVAVTGAVATFQATGESWVQVTDAKGAVVLNRTLKAGEAAEVSGLLPLSAVVGRADVTQVQVRGQAFDLRAVSKNNVARFEVK